MLDVCGLLKKYASEFNTLSPLLFLPDGVYPQVGSGSGKGGRGISHLDGLILYALAREHNVQQALEFSPHVGYSTAFFGAAVKKNGGHLHSIELDPRFAGLTRILVREVGLEDAVTVHTGDVFEQIHLIPHPIDMVFIDSDHSTAFAQRYVKEILPHVRGPVMVHDIAAGCVTNQLSPSQRDEAEVLKGFLTSTGKDFVLTHEVFGGQDGGSPALPVNWAHREIFELCRLNPADAFPFHRPPMSLVFQA